MASGKAKNYGPQQPAKPAIPGERKQYHNRQQRGSTVGARINGKDDVAAIELSAGNQVERCGKHSHPGCYSRRMQIELAGIHVRRSSLASECSQNHLTQFENQRKAKHLGVSSLRGEGLAQKQGKEKYRHRHDKSCNGSGDADIKQITPVANRRPDADERPQSPNQSWRRNKKRPGSKHLSSETQNVMAHLVRRENPQQTK